MTEQDWLTCTDPIPMLEFLRGQARDRKFRLFASACCRRLKHLMIDQRSRDSIDVAERFADGLASEQDLPVYDPEFRLHTLKCAALMVSIPRYDRPSILFRFGIFDLPGQSEDSFRRLEAICISGNRFPAEVALAITRTTVAVDPQTESPIQASLLRCVMGNPFRPATIDSGILAWNNGTVVKIAEKISDEQDFEGLHVLADALEEAGCVDDSILNHCREPGIHVRGCWVVDLILGKQ